MARREAVLAHFSPHFPFPSDAAREQALQAFDALASQPASADPAAVLSEADPAVLGGGYALPAHIPLRLPLAPSAAYLPLCALYCESALFDILTHSLAALMLAGGSGFARADAERSFGHVLWLVAYGVLEAQHRRLTPLQTMLFLEQLALPRARVHGPPGAPHSLLELLLASAEAASQSQMDGPPGEDSRDASASASAVRNAKRSCTVQHEESWQVLSGACVARALSSFAQTLASCFAAEACYCYWRDRDRCACRRRGLARPSRVDPLPVCRPRL